MTQLPPASNTSDANTAYLDALRIAGAFFVVLAHVSGGSADNFVPFSNAWWLCTGVYFLCTWSIPVFVMISGALLLHRPAPSFKAFYVRRFKRVGIPLVFWTVFYLGVRLWVDHEHLSVARTVDLLLQGQAYVHLWFLYMIAGLYLITPYLQILVQRMAPRHCLVMAGLILVGADAFHLLNVMVWGTRASVFTLFVPYISYYVLGHVLHHEWPRGHVPGPWIAGGAAVSAGYLLCLAKAFIALEGQQFGMFFFGFFSPPVAVLAVTVFWGFREVCTGSLRPALTHMASCTMGIYVVHLLVLKLMQIFLADEASDQPVWIGLVLGTLIAFGLSYGVVSVLKRLPGLWRIVG